MKSIIYFCIVVGRHRLDELDATTMMARVTVVAMVTCDSRGLAGVDRLARSVVETARWGGRQGKRLGSKEEGDDSMVVAERRGWRRNGIGRAA